MPNKAGFIDSWGPDWKRSWIPKIFYYFYMLFINCNFASNIIPLNLHKIEHK